MHDKDEFRDRIIEVSRAIFSEYGFKKTTIDDIAIALNKGKSSLYYYFPGKEDIFKAVIDREVSLLFSEVATALAKCNNPKDKLKTYIEVRILRFNETAKLYSILKNDFQGRIPAFDEVRYHYEKIEREKLIAILEEGVTLKQFDIPNTALTALSILCILKGMEVSQFWENDSSSPGQRIEYLLHVIFYGIIRR